VLGTHPPSLSPAQTLAWWRGGFYFPIVHKRLTHGCMHETHDSLIMHAAHDSLMQHF
jgi:hypothetical protein